MNPLIKKQSTSTEAPVVNVTTTASTPALDPNPVIDGSLYYRSSNDSNNGNSYKKYIILAAIVVGVVALYLMFKKAA